MSPVDTRALDSRCEYCGAPPGQFCRRHSRSTGEVTGRASYLHGARTQPLYDAWREGFTEGHADALYWVEHVAERRGRTAELAEVIEQLGRWLP